MAFVVEMASPVANTDVFLYFRCGGGTWDQTLDLARRWDWLPRGTSPDPVWKRQWDEYGKFTGDYECDEFGKVISADLLALFLFFLVPFLAVSDSKVVLNLQLVPLPKVEFLEAVCLKKWGPVQTMSSQKQRFSLKKIKACATFRTSTSRRVSRLVS